MCIVSFYEQNKAFFSAADLTVLIWDFNYNVWLFGANLEVQKFFNFSEA